MRRSQAANRLLLTLLAVFFLGCRPSETPTYRFVQTWGQRGDEPGEMREPVGIAVSGDEIFVSDAGNNRIQAFGADGAFRWMIPEDINWADTTSGRFNVATSVTVGPENNIYVADFYNHRIQIISEEGQFVSTFGTQGSGNGQFDRPSDLAFDADGNLYVLDFGNDRIQKFEPVH